jgi:glutathione S-transferase
MLVLYEFGNSVCCQKVRLVLCEKALAWESRQVKLFRSEQYRPDYLELNPKGVVPTLLHDGRPVIESTLICEYLEEIFPEPRLVPEAAYERARMRLWSKAVDEGLHEGVTEISFSAMFRERMKNMSEGERAARFRNVDDPRRRDRFVSTYEHGVESPFVLWASAAYERAFKSIDGTLAQGGEWLAGGAFSLAEVNLMPYLARLGIPSFARGLDRGPATGSCLVGTRQGASELPGGHRRPVDAARTRRNADVRKPDQGPHARAPSRLFVRRRMKRGALEPPGSAWPGLARQRRRRRCCACAGQAQSRYHGGTRRFPGCLVPGGWRNQERRRPWVIVTDNARNRKNRSSRKSFIRLFVRAVGA